MNFQQRLQELRRRAGLSQEELANLLGVSRQAVQKWEAGASRPDLDNLAALAEYFQVSLDYLVAGREPVTTAPPPSTTVIHNNYYGHCFEYKSRRTLFGLPLVHINYGFGFRRAKGIIALGNVATGVVAVGGLSFGLFSLGGASLGLLLSLGGLSVGCIALGGMALGLMAWGGIAIGTLAVGGLSWGTYAVGGAAIGSKVALGGAASAPVAVGADAQGAQAFLAPLTDADLSAASDAIQRACAGAPRWLVRLLQAAAQSLS